jgi:dihydrofolate synthase/folylpolyglutamate synthase
MAARSPRPLAMIVGMLTTKDSEAFLTPFRGLATEIVAVPVAGDHAGRAPGEIVAIASRLGLVAREADSVAAALDALAARAWPAPPRVLIAGSLYLAGAVLAENETPPT